MNKYQYLILDLDNTLYPPSSGMLKGIDNRIEDYINLHLSIEKEQIPKLRNDYWKKYGTTLGGLIKHHQINPEHYFQFAYQINPEDYLKKDLRLIDILNQIDLVKIVFSNSPREYIIRVLKVLGIEELISKIYDIRFVDFQGKPNLQSYQKVITDLQCEAGSCIIVEDTLINAVGAKQVGMKSVLIQSQDFSGVDWIIEDIYQLHGLMQGILGKSKSA